MLGILPAGDVLLLAGAALGIPADRLRRARAPRHPQVRRHGGRARLATTGIVLGSVGSTIFIGWVGFLVFAMATSSKSTPSIPPVAPTAPPTVVTTAPATPPGGWGSIHVVELHSSPTPLRSQMADEVKAAKAAGETVIVETTAAACTACLEIARAMRDPALQVVLAKVRLVRLDVREVGAELPAMGMKEATLPWFYLVDAHGDVRDAISADEWDDNDAESVAPVLDAFLHGKLRSRRRPWRGTTL